MYWRNEGENVLEECTTGRMKGRPLTQVSGAGGTAKALEMKHFGLCSHNKIVLGKNSPTGRALGAV